MHGNEPTEVPSAGNGEETTPRPRLHPVPKAAGLLGISARKCWELVYAERLRTVWIGHRRLVPDEALDDFVATLTSEKPEVSA